MIHFLNSLILPALIAVSLPIIIQLFNRNKNKNIKFSAVRFLKTLENKKVKQLKLYQILLLIVRALIILFLVLTFARPTLNAGRGASNTPATAVILLDDSYSMSAYAASKTYMEKANTLLPKILSAYGPDDKVYLIKMSNGKPLKLKDNIPPQKPALVTGIHIAQKAFNAADSLMARFGNAINDLFIISDFKLPAKMSLTPYKNLIAANRYVLDVAGDEPFLDLSIDSVAVENQIFEQGRPIRFRLFIRNHARKKTMETAVDLYNGKKRVARRNITVAPGQTLQTHLLFTPRQSGAQNLHFSIQEDDLPANNRYYYTLDIPKSIPVLFIHVADNPPLEQALTILKKNTLFKITQSDMATAASYNFSGYALIVLRGGQAIPQTLAEQIAAHAATKGPVLIIPAKNDNVTSFQSILNALSIRRTVLPVVTLTDGNYITLDMAAAPAFWGNVFLEQNKFNDPPAFSHYFKIHPKRNMILKFSNGDGLFYKTASYYLLTAPMMQKAGSLTENPLFIPFLYRIFYIAAMAHQQQNRQLTTGKDIRFFIPGYSSDKKYQLLTPDGQKVSILPEHRGRRLFLNGGSAREAGIYFLLENGHVMQSMAVNLSKREFHPPYVDKTRLGKTLKTDITAIIQKAHVGMEFWIYLILVALALILLEMFLVKKIEGTRF